LSEEHEEQRTVETSPLPASPDAAEVNAAWPAAPQPRRGLRRLLDGLVERLLAPRLDAQRRFNSVQVRLDNELLAYLDARLAATHRHYDRLLTQQGQRLDEVDERHRQLERELVSHVHDLVTRIDLVLGEANREKLALAFALEETRDRLAQLEQTLRREG
jgi:tRNA isopentenyl-2-thiomethyl-A-37 hydroxylase MiaE